MVALGYKNIKMLITHFKEKKKKQKKNTHTHSSI